MNKFLPLKLQLDEASTTFDYYPLLTEDAKIVKRYADSDSNFICSQATRKILLFVRRKMLKDEHFVL